MQPKCLRLAEALAAAAAAQTLPSSAAGPAAMQVAVPHQSGRGGKRQAALLALVGSLAAVDGLVLGQVGRLGEALVADGAGVRPHAGVGLPVLCHAAGQAEGLAAVGAGKGPLAQVLALVALQRQGLVESLAAVRAREGLVIGVRVAFVLAQVGRADEVFAAGAAGVGFLTGVRADVLAVVRGPDVRPGAEGAVVGTLARVQTLVLLQRALVGVGLAARVAHVRLEARVCLQVTLEVAELLEGPVAVRTLEGTLLCIRPAAALLHCHQKSSNLVTFVLFERSSDRIVGTSLLFSLRGRLIIPLLKSCGEISAPNSCLVSQCHSQ